MLFLVLASAVNIDIKRRQGNTGHEPSCKNVEGGKYNALGQSCTDDTQCETEICRRLDQGANECHSSDKRNKEILVVIPKH
ncbi:3694_t:CDS:1, partial [Gigaspora margarita]